MHNTKGWVRDVFDRAAPSYGEHGCQYFNEFGKQLVVLAELNLGEKILDVATGKGAILSPASKVVGAMGTAVGIDLSPVMIEEARKRDPLSSTHLLVMDAEELSFPSHFFDVVFCGFALFFFPNLTIVFNEFKRVLKRGGRIAVSTFGKPSSLTQWVFNKTEQFGAHKLLKVQPLDSTHILNQVLSQAGFCRIHIQESTQFFWHSTPEEWWNSLWSHGIRSRLEQLAPVELAVLHRESLEHAKKAAHDGKVREEIHVIFGVAHQ